MPSEPAKIGILVVDDHAEMREGLTAVINAQPDMIVVGEAGNGEEAIQQFRNLRPDLALLDWNLPVLSGEEVLKTVRAEFPRARVIVISSLNDEDGVRQALRLGAQGYLHKDGLRRELIPAIRSIHQGQEYLPQQPSKRLKKDK